MRYEFRQNQIGLRGHVTSENKQMYDYLEETKKIIRRRIVKKIKKCHEFIRIFDYCNDRGIYNVRETSMMHLIKLQIELSDLVKIYTYNNSMGHSIRVYRKVVAPTTTIIISDSESDTEVDASTDATASLHSDT